MNNTLANGVWPTAVTPFDADNRIDVQALNSLVNFYYDAGVAGIFGVCQSSEMFYLNRNEREYLAQETMRAADGKLPVILSGHVSDNPASQADELKAMASLGPKAVVLVTNRLAATDESDNVWFENLRRLIDHLPEDMLLGFYECPYPYKRLLSPELLIRCAALGRFGFLKDTCCNALQIRAKLDVLRGTGLKLFNANAATLLVSLRDGAAGYSGVMANFHPALYVRLCRDWSRDPEGAGRLMDFLGPASVIECRSYPTSAKYHLSLDEVPFGLTTRSMDPDDFLSFHRLELEQLHRLARRLN
ncbi:4-hydroxy-tetrahydrodipicolinate synthase [Olavius algarvensis spirochete endosymbiont]|uniref:dihydrodipicolinate synthase family protein n=1 Tax=Olavius algarvensis spirochete endosymbiont TaxID=260710 RepID=UPI000F183DD1|nr:dihydrodipicolinate synthase family protein [Olavius algarvensis spirochete endosymbiont]VDB00076.1 4-hydroxy-tetrahydrodipicolinate synthase [Olavius algarvensis spirochete endosymbiont]